MNNFLDITETFVKNINNSLVERDQWIDSFEILLDKMRDLQTQPNVVEADFARLLSMLEVLIKSMKYAQDIDEDAVLVYEKRKLKPFREKLNVLDGLGA